MASHLIDQFQEYNKPNTDRKELMEREPYLIGLMSTSDTHQEHTVDMNSAEGQQRFIDAVGLDNALRCADLTPAQKTHVYNIAKDRSWNTTTSDIVPQLAASAFPGIKLTAMTTATTARNMDQSTYGNGRAYYLFLDTKANHYVPAFAG